MLSWLSLVPPIILFITACFTQSLIIALCFALFSAGAILSQGNPHLFLSLIFNRSIDYINDLDTIMLYLFLFGIGMLIALFTLIKDRYKDHPNQKMFKLKSTRTIEYFTAFLMFTFSIDDYLSILSVGFLARQFIKKFQMNAERFASIIHSLSGPVVILFPLSSWATAIIAQLDQAGLNSPLIGIDPIIGYLQSLPYLFYSIFLIFSLIFYIQTQTNFEKTILYKKTRESFIPLFQLIDVFIPLVIMIIGIIIGLLFFGNHTFFGGSNNFFNSIRANKSIFFIFCISTWFAFFIGFLKARYDKLTNHKDLFSIIKNGFLIMHQSCYIIFLSSVFAAFIRNDLKTGIYLAEILLSKISINFIPFISFLSASIITIFIGSAWGTFALMIPIIVQIITVYNRLDFLFPALGAILSGGVLGNQISLFSETTIMTSTTLNITPLQHISSQIWYAIPSIITSLFLYILLGLFDFFKTSLPALLGIGIIICLICIIVLHKIFEKLYQPKT